MSLSRKIRRIIVRDDLALELIYRKGGTFGSESRVCLAGNLSAGIRRRALRAVAHEIENFQPTLKGVRIIKHLKFRPCNLGDDGTMVDNIRIQEIPIYTRYNRASILAKTQLHLAEIAGKATK